jgi:DNA adenine methylase
VLFTDTVAKKSGSPTVWKAKYFHIKKILNLINISKVLQNIEITNMDYRDILDRDKKSFLYMDPPYEIKDKLYTNHSLFNHEQFIDNILNIPNEFILTYQCSDININKLKRFNIIKSPYSYCLNQSIVNGEKKRNIKNEYLIYSINSFDKSINSISSHSSINNSFNGGDK